LTDVYKDIGVSVDRLITEPSAIDQLAEEFASRTRHEFVPSRLVRELLRIRKAGKLPKLAHKTAG
jgi:hypothetical protein